MEILRVDVAKEAEVLFELDNKAFHREFDLPSRDVQEQKNYLQKSDVYVLYDGGEPVGFFALEKDDVGVEVKSVVVLPEKQRRGYGTVMLNEILELTKGSVVHLVTHPKNTSAIAYYLKSGFRVYGQKDNYYGDGEPRLLLKREA